MAQELIAQDQQTPTCNTGSTEQKLAALRNLPERLDDELLARCKALADAPLRQPAPMDSAKFAQRMAMVFTLPRQRGSDPLASAVKGSAYDLVLGGLPAPQIDWMVDEIMRTCEWVPPPAKCLSIAQTWPGVGGVSVEARRLAHQRYLGELDARTTDLHGWKRRIEAGLIDQDDIDAMPGWMVRALIRFELLVRCPDCEGVTLRKRRRVAEFPFWLPGLEARALALKYGAPTELPKPDTTEEGPRDAQ